MPAISTVPAAGSASARRRRIAFLAYAALVVAALASGSAALGAAVALILVSMLLLPALRRGAAWAWATWPLAVAAIGALALSGRGALALGAMPALIAAALCALFASTLARGRRPLIARVIEVTEGAERLALPGVARYARNLTAAWALLFGAQAFVSATLLVCMTPGGAAERFGVRPPFAVPAAFARIWLDCGGLAVVAAFLLAEYAFRRRRLAHIPHPSLARFLAGLTRSWPDLVRGLAGAPHGEAR
ncbi:MAG TPA: xanthomonadin biosynthesis protein [Dokdonella sp.]